MALSALFYPCLALLLLVNLMNNVESLCTQWSNWLPASESCQWISPCQCARAVRRVCNVGNYAYVDSDDCSVRSELFKTSEPFQPCQNQSCPLKTGWAEWESWSNWNREVCPQTRFRHRGCTVGSGRVPGSPMGGCPDKRAAFHSQNSTLKQCPVENQKQMTETITSAAGNFPPPYGVYVGIGVTLFFLIAMLSVVICYCCCCWEKNSTQTLREILHKHPGGTRNERDMVGSHHHIHSSHRSLHVDAVQLLNIDTMVTNDTGVGGGSGFDD